VNKKIKVLALVHITLGGGGIAACMAAYLTWVKLVSDAHSLRTVHTLGQMMFMLSMFILLPGFICGIGLLLDKSWGRVVAIGWSMLLLLVIPIGTLLGGYGLWVLLKSTATQTYPQSVEQRSK
jgi:ACR3 family arsenite efflux pump ArsB